MYNIWPKMVVMSQNSSRVNYVTPFVGNSQVLGLSVPPYRYLAPPEGPKPKGPRQTQQAQRPVFFKDLPSCITFFTHLGWGVGVGRAKNRYLGSQVLNPPTLWDFLPPSLSIWFSGLDKWAQTIRTIVTTTCSYRLSSSRLSLLYDEHLTCSC